MAQDLIQSALWPGVTGFLSGSGTCSHGISPSTFQLQTTPEVGALPLPFGDLRLTDGLHPALVIRGCRLNLTTAHMGPEGQTLLLEIQDRRWRWAGYGAVDGRFNRMDSNGKLVPWDIRSPYELAVMCLDAMDEPNYIINLPQGLSQADGKDLNRYLRLGENFRQSLANAPVTWDRTPPAQALARLCEFFGCRVVMQYTFDRVLIVPLGVGSSLPDLPSEVIAPSVRLPPAPSVAGVAGTVRYQARFALEAVGKEWDGSHLPINLLSYAPRSQAAPQITTVTFTGTLPPAGLELQFSWTPLVGAPYTEVAVRSTDPGITIIAARYAAIVAAINANAALSGLLTASVSGNVLTLTGKTNGQNFAVSPTQPLGGAPAYQPKVVQVARPGGGDWSTCPPPSFTGVLATDRLSTIEARRLAQASVFKCYRIKAVSPFTGLPPLKVPLYGEIKRRQQIILQPSCPEQITPQARIAGGVNKGALLPEGQLNGGILPPFYSGYSRDRQNFVFGAVSRLQCGGSVFWLPKVADGGTVVQNTKPTDRVFVEFATDPIEQMIVFNDYVFASALGGGGWIAEPELVLEAGCLVCDPNTDAPSRWLQSVGIGGLAPPEWAIHDDIQVGVIGTYTDDHGLTGYTLVGDKDANARAQYYINGMTIQYQLQPGLTRQYPGIISLDCDGAIQQVSWSFGEGGPTTIASLNLEHSSIIPPFPARRLKENLPPNKAAAAANAAEAAFTLKTIPRPSGAVQ